MSTDMPDREDRDRERLAEVLLTVGARNKLSDAAGTRRVSSLSSRRESEPHVDTDGESRCVSEPEEKAPAHLEPCTTYPIHRHLLLAVAVALIAGMIGYQVGRNARCDSSEFDTIYRSRNPK